MPTVGARRSGRRIIILAAGIAGLTAAVALTTSLRRPAPPRRAFAPGFAGSEACAECHPEIARSQADSHHAQSLAEAGAFAARDDLPEPRWLPDPDLPRAYRITDRHGRIGVEAQEGPDARWQPMEWAFGSGNTGVTLVGRRVDGGYVESAVSYYRRAGWDFTPGFLGRPPEERRKAVAGKQLSPEEAGDCFECHATGVLRAPERLDLSLMEKGVRCERCHGPGARHVELARSGQPAGAVELPGGSSGKAQVRACGVCHRSELPPGLKLESPVVARFAPIGFSRSRCFLGSNDSFTCTTCHDPHTNVRKEPEYYRAICAGCHGGKPRLSVCPVRPQGDCVSCHMPKRLAQRNGLFTDHRIAK